MKTRKRCYQIFVIGILLLSLCGCKKDSRQDQAEPTATEEEIPASVPETFVYTFNPHVISDEYTLIYGEGIREEFFLMCDAILSGEDSFPCASKERFHQLLSISDSCFPLARELIETEKTETENGVCHLHYRYDEEKTEKKKTSFIDKVTSVIETAVPYREPDCIVTMELFTAVARKDTYDDSYTLEDSLKLRSYRAIMEDIGICQEITGEYIYYLLQVGIDAIPCSSLNRDQSEAHEWTMVKLDGLYYHMDPTYATTYPDSLFFFGMDDVQREYYGDLPADRYTYANSDLLDRDTYAVTDRRFEKYWLAEKYEIDHAEGKITISEINTDARHEYMFD